MRRLARSLVAILGATIIVLTILRIAPGDPARLLLGELASQEAVDDLRENLGLNDPLPVQIGNFLADALRGDLGESLTHRRPALDVILEAFPYTVALALASFLISIFIAVPIGILAAARRDSFVDHLFLSGLLVAQSIPHFWLGIMLIVIFSVELGWFPTSGAGTLRHLVLPAVTLSTYQYALLARTVRTGMLEVLNKEFITTAEAKGLRTSRVLWGHAFRNTLLPIVTILALQLGLLLGGSYVVEAVFAWPGLGTLALRAISARDYPLVQAIVLFSSGIIVTLNFLADLLYPILDPRVRDAG